MTTLLPGYPAVLATLRKPRALHRWNDLLGGPARLLTGTLDGTHPLLVLEAPRLFAREGGLYTDALGRDWDDNWHRFAAGLSWRGRRLQPRRGWAPPCWACWA